MHHKIGKAWLIIEKDENSGISKLLSIIPPRLTSKYVRFFVEQTYVDRYGDLNERIIHKKRTSRNLRAVNNDSVITLKIPGESRFIVAYYAMNSRIKGDKIYFTFPKFVPYKTDYYNIVESDELAALI